MAEIKDLWFKVSRKSNKTNNDPLSATPNTSNSPAPAANVQSSQTAFSQPQQATDPMAVTGQTNSSYKLYDPNLGNQYNSVISGMLSGSAYDATEKANKEALNRVEQQQRANSADQINRFGGVGQGIGGQLANSTESNILSNRFQQSLADTQAREALKQQGLSAYENSINAENNLTNVDRNNVALDADKAALEKNRFELQQTKSSTADAISGDFAAYIQNWTGSKGATAEQIGADQGAMNAGQQMWESMGGTGQVSADWVKGMADRINDPVLNDTFASAMNDAKSYLSQKLINQDEYNAMVQINKLALTGGVIVDENGNLVLKNIGEEETDKQRQADRAEQATNISTGIYSYADYKNDPELLQLAKESAAPMNVTTSFNDDSEKREFAAVPEKNVPFVWKGKAAIRTSDVTGDKEQKFSITYIDSGETDTINSYGMPTAETQQNLYEQYKHLNGIGESTASDFDNSGTKVEKNTRRDSRQNAVVINGDLSDNEADKKNIQRTSR